MLKYLDFLHDSRVECYSVLVSIAIDDYLSLVESVYKNRGGIEGQRSPLKTKSAQRIRKRLIDDLSRGTVIPPVVIGVRLEEDKFKAFAKDIPKNSLRIFDGIDLAEQISIIDGMQRTTALFEAIKAPKFDRKGMIRLELWVAKSTNSLIYRMLVLNSGQIPWNIGKQLEVVFNQLRKEVVANVKGIDLFDGEDNSRRSKGGQYQSKEFVELFILFGTRRVSVDIQEQLAEEFARLDIIETSGNDDFTKMFYGVSQLLVDLDNAFCKLPAVESDFELRRFKTGKAIFASQPARAGFMVAASQMIFGIPGIDLDADEQAERFQKVERSVRAFIARINSIQDESELFTTIDLPTLDEQLNIRSGKVGTFEREYFFEAFKTFFDLANSKSFKELTPIWRAHH